MQKLNKNGFKGDILTFNKENIKKPMLLRLIEMPESDKFVFVEHQKNKKIYKWFLGTKQLKKLKSYFRVLMMHPRKHRQIIKVTYLGEVHNNKQFNIQQRVGGNSKWYDISHNMKYIDENINGDLVLQPPKSLGGGVLLLGKDVALACKLRDKLCEEGYNLYRFDKGRAPNGVGERVTEYLQQNPKIVVEDLIKVYYTNDKEDNENNKTNTKFNLTKENEDFLKTNGININNLVNFLRGNENDRYY